VRSPPAFLGWTLVAVVTSWWVASLPPASAPAPVRALGVGGRLLGPFAGLAADVQWIRVDDAARSGRGELVLARAETALELAPGATEGWLFLARYLAFERASAEREPDPGRRRAWVTAGLALARRGESAAREPGELAAWQGLVRVKEADEGDLDWPGGPRALLETALADFERAASLGHPEGRALADGVRRRLSRE